MTRTDARLPIRFGALESRQANEAVLLDRPGLVAEPTANFMLNLQGHAAGCLCCRPRSGAGRALAELFRRRAVAHEPAFTGVLAVVGADGEVAVRTALAEDLVVASRYRLASC